MEKTPIELAGELGPFSGMILGSCVGHCVDLGFTDAEIHSLIDFYLPGIRAAVQSSEVRSSLDHFHRSIVEAGKK